MPEITASLIKDLREKTGAGMMECKKALTENNGDMEAAIDWLRKKGLSVAAKKAGRVAAQGLVCAKVEGNKGAVAEVNIETDFAAKNPEFREFVKDVAMQIAAAKPEYVKKEDVPEDVLEKEKEVIKAQAMNEGKPAEIAEKMVAGRIEKYYKEVCLLEQEFVKNPDITIGQLLTEKIANIGENITIRRFVRFERGEGLQKKEENFAEEVMKQMNG